MDEPTKTAHLSEIYDHCEGVGCWKAATRELIDKYDVPQGRFCGECGKRALTRLRKEEETETRS